MLCTSPSSVSPTKSTLLAGAYQWSTGISRSRPDTSLEAHAHIVSNPISIELPKSERTRDSITNLGNIAKSSPAAVKNCAYTRRQFRTGAPG